MRKHMILSLLFLVLITVVAAGAKGSSKKKYHQVQGDIESVDATAKTLTVTRGGGESATFKIDSSTKYSSAGKSIDFRDLKAGEEVRVSYR